MSRDYFNFSTQSTKTTKVRNKYFQAAKGNWSGSGFVNSWQRGGEQVRTIESTETLSITTEYLTEETGRWLESVINSPEVYIINKGSDWKLGDTAISTFTDWNDYIEPVKLISNSIKSKNIENDKLIFHSLMIEKQRKNNTHRL